MGYVSNFMFGLELRDRRRLLEKSTRSFERSGSFCISRGLTMDRRFGSALLMMVAMVWAMPALAQDKKPEEKKPAEKKPAEKQPPEKKPDAGKPAGGEKDAGDKGAGGQEGGMDPAMMEAWMKSATPGPHHDHLKQMVGEWNVAGKFRMAPDQPWEESKSTCKAELVLGGRFFVQHVVGEPSPSMPMPFEGIGYMGYDNDKQKYVSTWMDNYGTMIMIGEGTCDGSGKTITSSSKFFDPMTKKDTWAKWIYKIEGADKFVLQGVGPDEAGKEFVNMELTYTRKK
ncbi:MAG: DUF1579 domain-containing protein [Phycisphaerales bacterium]|nr:DUF1579 domain-containing protein [Phycisphaerales bacterium]